MAQGDDLGQAIAGLLDDPAVLKDMAKAAEADAAGQRQAFDAGFGLIRERLP